MKTERDYQIYIKAQLDHLIKYYSELSGEKPNAIVRDYIYNSCFEEYLYDKIGTLQRAMKEKAANANDNTKD